MVSLPFLKSDMIPTPPFVWEKYEKLKKLPPPPLSPSPFLKEGVSQLRDPCTQKFTGVGRSID